MLLRCVRWILDYKIDYAEVKNIEKERKVLGFRFKVLLRCCYDKGGVVIKVVE